MIQVILILKVLGLSWFINRFPLLGIIFSYLPENIFTLVFKLMFECLKCLSFWIGLLMGGIWIGLISSFIGMLYEKILGDWEKNIKI
jgi:hypothetical protein